LEEAMALQKSREQIRSELEQLMNRADYKLLKPILEGVQPVVNAEAVDVEIANEVLENVKSLQAEMAKSKTPYEVIKKAATSGFNQPNLNVEGDLYQAGRDVVNQPKRDQINNITIQIINNKLDEIKRDMPDVSLEISVILLVMTATEATQLASGDAFKDYTESVYTDEFKELQKVLGGKLPPDWPNNYGKTSQDWKPFNGNETIADLIAQSLRDIEGIQKPLVPKFIDIRTLNEETKLARRNLKELRHNGCIIVMDVISIRHPVIQHAYRRSLLDAFPNVMIVRIAPTGDALNIVQQMIRFSERLIDLEFYKRFKVDLDAKCDQVSDSLELTRWLVGQTPQLVPNEQKAKGGNYGEWYK
jgi:hypothetical protein